jgi:hypothetical protein
MNGVRATHSGESNVADPAGAAVWTGRSGSESTEIACGGL